MAGPLEGIRVVDLGHAGVGPYAASLMGQLGAEVVKVEPPWGDIIHQSGGGAGGKNGFSTFYIGLGLNKRAIVLNIKEPTDREIFFKLVGRSDVYLDNWRAGAADRNGIGWDVLSKVNPRLVYVNSSGFGARGPLKEMGSYDPYGEMFAGITQMQGAPGSRGERAKGGVRIDTTTSLCIVEMVLAGLWHRDRTGKGQHVQGSQMESSVQHISVRAIEHLNFGITPKPMGSAHPHMVPSQCFQAKDAWFAVSAQNPQEWRGFCAALGRVEWIFDPRFHDNAARVGHREDLVKLIEPIMAQRTVKEWVAALQARRVPSGPILDHDDHIKDPHIMGNGLLRRVVTPWGEMVLPPIPLRFSATPTEVRPTPKPGADTAAVLAELGYGPEHVRVWEGPAQRMAAAQRRE